MSIASTVAEVLFLTAIALLGAYFFWVLYKKPYLKITACILTAGENIISVGFKTNTKGYIAPSSDSVYAIDDTTGIILPILNLPRFGKMATPRCSKNRHGYFMIANYGHMVKRGSSITVVIANHKKKSIVI